MITIEIKKQSILEMDVDCVVNAANDRLARGGGICGAIFAAADATALTRACNAIGHCDTGSAVITDSCGLRSNYIIHAVGPIWMGGNKNEPQQLYGCYRRALELARENGIHSIAFPLISSGIFGYPKEKAWDRALQACMDYSAENTDYELSIVIGVLDAAEAEQGKRMLELMSSGR